MERRSTFPTLSTCCFLLSPEMKKKIEKNREIEKNCPLVWRPARKTKHVFLMFQFAIIINAGMQHSPNWLPVRRRQTVCPCFVNWRKACTQSDRLTFALARLILKNSPHFFSNLCYCYSATSVLQDVSLFKYNWGMYTWHVENKQTGWHAPLSGVCANFIHVS